MSDTVLEYFKSCLSRQSRADGNFSSRYAKGDCCIMLQLIRMKLDAFERRIDPANPGRFRGTTEQLKDMQSILGNVPRFHVMKWGASHMRGSLRDDEGRGNKRHIIQLIGLLNEFQGTEDLLRQDYASAIRAHHGFWESFSLSVRFQQTDTIQSRVLKLLQVASLGRVQQGLVYSALRLRYGDTRSITTKKVFAGDEQSSRHDGILKGDIQVRKGKELVTCIEVKDACVDATSWERVATTHGEHTYDLFVLANTYRPASLQFQISTLKRTYAVHLADFLFTTLFLESTEQHSQSSNMVNDLLRKYNTEFCDEIEHDQSIKISCEEE